VEGRIPWRFLPDVDASSTDEQSPEDSKGIWLPDMPIDAVVDIESEHLEEGSDAGTDATGSDLEDDTEVSSAGSESEAEVQRRPAIGVQSRFAALNIGAEDSQSEEESEAGDSE
jgi:hypothetical protein